MRREVRGSGGADTPFSRVGWSVSSRRARQTQCRLKRGWYGGTFCVSVRNNSASKTSRATGANVPWYGWASLARTSILACKKNTWAPGARAEPIPWWRSFATSRSSEAPLVMPPPAIRGVAIGDLRKRWGAVAETRSPSFSNTNPSRYPIYRCQHIPRTVRAIIDRLGKI